MPETTKLGKDYWINVEKDPKAQTDIILCRSRTEQRSSTKQTKRFCRIMDRVLTLYELLGDQLMVKTAQDVFKLVLTVLKVCQ